MKDCYKYKTYFSDYIDGNISETLKKQLLMHLEICEKCRTAVNEMINTKKALKSLAQLKTSPDFDIILKSKIRKEARRHQEQKWFTFISTDSLKIPALAFSAALLILFGVILDRTVFESDTNILQLSPFAEEQSNSQNSNAIKDNDQLMVNSVSKNLKPEGSYESYYQNSLNQMHQQSTRIQPSLSQFQQVSYSNTPVSKLNFDAFNYWQQNPSSQGLRLTSIVR